MGDENRKSFYIANLDLFRFIAAFMIVIGHTYEGWSGWWGAPGFMTDGIPNHFSSFGFFLDRIIRNMGFGVDIFFLISGFLITSLLMQEKQFYGKINIRNFYIRRTLRIWPLYFFAVAISPFLVSWLGEPSPDYLSTALFYNNFHSIHTESWAFPFAHFWSICIEEHFYVLWPLIIAFIPNKKLPTIFSIIIFISIAFRWYEATYNPFPWFPLYLNTLSRMDALVIGSLFGYMNSIKPIQINTPLVTRGLLYILFIVMFTTDILVEWNGVFMACFKKYFYLLIIGFAMMNYLFNKNAIGIIKKKTIFHYFGKISYGIYIYHNILLLIIIKKVMIPYGIGNMYVFFLMMFAGSIIIPILSYELFEKWFLKLKSRFEIIRTSPK